MYHWLFVCLCFFFLPTVSCECLPSLLESCPNCCAILFDDHHCNFGDAFLVKVNADGVLGAIWDNSVVSTVVRHHCLLELWEFKNQTGTHRTFGLEGITVYNLDHFDFERRASSLRCKCVYEIQPPATTIASLPTITQAPPITVEHRLTETTNVPRVTVTETTVVNDMENENEENVEPENSGTTLSDYENDDSNRNDKSTVLDRQPFLSDYVHID